MEINEADGEFRRHGGQFEEHLVQPEKLEVIQSFAGALHVTSGSLSVALAKSECAPRDLGCDGHSPIA